MGNQMKFASRRQKKPARAVVAARELEGSRLQNDQYRERRGGASARP
jgi:hypothetical protein